MDIFKNEENCNIHSTAVNVTIVFDICPERRLTDAKDCGTIDAVYGFAAGAGQNQRI